jgi:anti-sigma regulatory factor (Ser/Thr protein kinase)
VGLARKLTREWFRHWGLPQEVGEAAELVASELVTNSVTKAKGDTMRLRIRWWQDTGYVEVWDGDPAPPIQRQPSEGDTNGWGLGLVEAYSSRWNYYPSVGGKVVWAELHVNRARRDTKEVS